MKKIILSLSIILLFTTCDLFNEDDFSNIIRVNPNDPGSAVFIGVVTEGPEDGAILDNIPSINWIGKPDAIAYHLILADNPELNNPIIDNNTLTGTSYEFNILLENNKSFYWNIRYQNTDLQWSIWNRVQTFKLSITYPKFKWKYTLGGSITTSPALGFDGTVYIGASDGKLYAINKDGTKKWEFSTGAAIISSPSIATDGTIHVISSGSYLYAINPDGTEKWNFYLGDFTTPASSLLSIAIGLDGTIYCPGLLADWVLYAIKSDGTEKWNLISGNLIYDISINVTAGLSICAWRDLQTVNSIGIVESNYVTTDGAAPRAFSSDNKAYFVKNGYLSAINPDSTKLFKVIINNAGANPTFTSPSISSNNVIYSISGIDEKLYAYDLNGNFLWKYSPQERHDLGFAGTLLGKDGTIFMPSIGEVIAINQNGTEKWIFTINASVKSTPVLSDTGVLYFGASDDSIYAIETGCPGLDDGPWPKNQKDNQNTGRY